METTSPPSEDLASQSVLVGRVEGNDAVAIITLNRPASLNSLTHSMLAALRSAFVALDADRNVRAVVVVGADRAFSAGLDLVNPGQPPNSDNLGEVQYKFRFQRHFAELIETMHGLRVALVAAVNGAAVGAGLAIALACDTRVAGPMARFGVAPIRIGLSGADVGISYYLPRAIGTTRAFEMMLTGRIVEAAEASLSGLVLRVADDALAEAIVVAEQIASNSPFGLWMTRDAIWANIDATSLHQAILLEDRTQVLASLTTDRQEALHAFKEHRSATFKDH